MKTLIKIGIFSILLGLIILYKDNIVDIYNEIVIKFSKEDELIKNEYYKKDNYEFIKNTNEFRPAKKQDLYNIYYTVINSGMKKYSFYCNPKYKKCVDDIKEIASNRNLLSNINNYVHPYNSFSNIETEYNNYGKITIKLTHAYTKDQRTDINKKVKEIENELFNNKNLSEVEKIKLIHDYIINTTTYDSDRSDNNIIKYKSDIAYGPLYEHYAICGGYSDLMAIFLNNLKIKNYKISTNSHVWNAVYINGNWLHIDLTWDDPITSDKSNIIDHKFLLINTNKLIEIENKQHNFDNKIYKELAIK